MVNIMVVASLHLNVVSVGSAGFALNLQNGICIMCKVLCRLDFSRVRECVASLLQILLL